MPKPLVSKPTVRYSVIPERSNEACYTFAHFSAWKCCSYFVISILWQAKLSYAWPLVLCDDSIFRHQVEKSNATFPAVLMSVISCFEHDIQEFLQYVQELYFFVDRKGLGPFWHRSFSWTRTPICMSTLEKYEERFSLLSVVKNC